jgi:lactose/L-arabinose transport system substrate-binding protein
MINRSMHVLSRIHRTLCALSAMTLMGVASGMAAEPVNLWISSFQDKVYYEKMVEQYRAKVDPDFSAQIQAFGFREMPDKLAIAIKTGNQPPDIVQLDEVLFGSYLSGEVPFVNLADRVKASGLDQGIVPQRLKLFTQGDAIYGLPQSLSAMVLYYRTDLFKEHGINPADLATWDAFMEQGRDLAVKNQALIALDPTYFEILLRQKGSDWFDRAGRMFPDEAEAESVMRWLHNLNDEGIGLIPERASIFDPVFFSSMVNYGEVLTIIGADWYGLDMMQQFSPELKGKWGVMPLPAWKDRFGVPGPRTSTFAGQGLLIYKNSKKIDAAWKFIEWVIRDTDANVERFVGGNSFPAYEPAWKDPRMHQPSAYFSGQKLGDILSQLAPELPEVIMHPKRPQAVFLFQENFFSSLMYGQISPRETMRQMRTMLKQ